MKFTKYFMPFAALAFLASCSDDKVVDQPVDQTKGESYLALNITFSGAPGTKATVKTEAGSVNENAVINGRILLFQKAGTEANSTFVKSATFTDVTGWSNGSGTIEKTNKLTAKFEDLPEGVDFYGLVVLNTTTDLKDPDYGTTFQSWSETAINNNAEDYKVAFLDNNSQGFTMSNIAKWDGTSSVTNLTSITSDDFKTTPELAQNSPVTVYVQRVVAKVRLASGIEDEIDVLGYDGEENGDKVTLKKWGLDLTNKSTYPVQVVRTLDTYFTPGTKYGRFTENFSSDGYGRFYWAIDPNYDTSFKSTAFNTLDDDEDLNTITGSDDHEYCLENTMNYDAMTENVSTRIIFKGEYQVEGEESATSFFKIGNTLYTAKILSTLVDESISFNEETESGANVALSSIINNEDSKSLKAVTDYLGLAGTTEVAYYKDGECYYTAIIRHFTNSEAALPDNYAGLSSYTEDQMGRYGVLRNNIYDVSINSVKGPGLPEFPDTPDDDNPDPDDPVSKDYYIALNINIIYWSVRENAYDLK